MSCLKFPAELYFNLFLPRILQPAPKPLPDSEADYMITNCPRSLTVWGGGEISMCYAPPTLITVHFDLVQHFIEDTVLQLVTGN
jgi:hypothetical protein